MKTSKEITDQYNERSVPNLRYHTFNLLDINADYVNEVLSDHYRDLFCQVKDVTVAPIGGGFNSEITGSGIFKIVVDGRVGDKPAPSLILKSTLPYRQQQDTLFKRLINIGNSDFVDILDKYPSNRIAQRELMSYLFLPEKIPIRMPMLYLGVIDEETDQSWIFMEDLSSLRSMGQEDWTKGRIKLVLQNMAGFHSAFWGKSSSLDTISWIGRWWGNKDNDYAAKDVARYAVRESAKYHPDLLTPGRLRILEKALSQRESIHNLFIQEPQTIIHWDFGPQNLRVDKAKTNEEQLVVFDWQTTSIGLPQWDIAQFLMPIIETGDKEQIHNFINFYISMLPSEIRNKIDMVKFMRTFDLVVLDHFFRVCGSILLTGKSIDKKGNLYSEWKNCLNWIEAESARWI
ncbi:MAG: aminoglycoside phosphotransferase family protein [Candidatus Levybacteria bacterium]|nr:aminoglycoside phosphotransferase family protein [Candidatus Levybacteria bacterium]